MDAKNLVTELGRRMGLEDLTLDGHGNAATRTEEGLHVEFQASNDGVKLHLLTLLGTPREEQSAALMYDLLRANANASGIGVPVFAWSEDDRAVILSTTLHVDDQTVDTAEHHLQHLIDRASMERTRLSDAGLSLH